MTVFNDCNKIIVYNPSDICAEYISAKARTVIIDSTLLESNQEHRYRFTVGHECGHWIFHKLFYDKLIQQGKENVFVECLELSNANGNDTSSWNDAKWMEWQADQFSAAILMPETAVRKVTKHKTYTKISDLSWALAHGNVIDTFNVSPKAAFNRLKNLGIFNFNVGKK